MSDPIAPIRAAVAGRYTIERQIGQGAFATVYLARDLRHDRNVAIKILTADPDSELGEQRFLREIRFLARLQHPNILPLIDSGLAGPMLFYVMPYVSGETLRARMQRERPLPVHEAVCIAREMADGLDHAHRNGVVHRDIKPENVLLSAGHPMIADFGIARAIGSAGVRQITRTGSGAPGTPAYMSPEQLMNDGDGIDGRSDTYSLGCVLYEMLTGQVPFPGKEGFVRRFSAPPPPPSLARRDLPPELDDVVVTAMAPAANDRFASGESMRDALAVIEAALVRDEHPEAGSSASRPAMRAEAAIIGASGIAGRPAPEPSRIPDDAGASSAARRRSAPRLPARHAVAGMAVASLVLVAAVTSRMRHDAVASARNALYAGHVTAALVELRAAAANDTSSAPAALWLAQALVLAGEDTARSARLAARRAADAAARLAPLEAQRAVALGALAAGELGRACAALRTLHAALPSDAPIEFTLAECHARDDKVVPDSTSVSGWRFRGERDLAIRLYQDLLERLPAGHEVRRVIYAHLPPLLTLEWGKYRFGHLASDSSLGFGAFPSLERRPGGDSTTTVVYTPYPLSEFRAGQPWMNPPGMEGAWERDRAILRTTAVAAVAEQPGNAAYHALLARALELAGVLASPDPAVQTALSEVTLAREATSSGAARAAMRFAQVRILLKHDEFARAGALAESTLAMIARPSRDDIDVVAAMHALLGHARRLAALDGTLRGQDHRMPDGRSFRVNPAVEASVLAFAAYAQLGGPRDSLLATRDRTERQIRSYAAPRARDSVRVALIGRSLTVAVPVLGPAVVVGLPSRDPLAHAQQALARGDARGVRGALDSLRRGRMGHSAAAVHLDQVFQEAWLRTAVGDSALALQQLDDALNGLPALGSSFLATVAEAGAVGRATALRAALADARGDTATARRWWDATRALRRTADPELRPLASAIPRSAAGPPSTGRQ